MPTTCSTCKPACEFPTLAELLYEGKVEIHATCFGCGTPNAKIVAHYEGKPMCAYCTYCD